MTFTEGDAAHARRVHSMLTWAFILGGAAVFGVIFLLAQQEQKLPDCMGEMYNPFNEKRASAWNAPCITRSGNTITSEGRLVQQ